MHVGVIGLGKVGIGVSESLLDAGYDVIGYDISESVQRRAEEIGVTVASDTGEVAERAKTIILSLPHPDASRAAVESIGEHSEEGTTVLDTSTLSPATAKALAEEAAEWGVHYHDCPITGGAVGAAAGELTVMAGGDVERLREDEEVLSALAENVYHIGDVGDAQLVKLIHNQVGQTVLLIFVEGLFLADEWGVDPAVVYRTLRHYTQIYDDKLDAFFGNAFDEDFVEHFIPEWGAEEVRLGPDQRFNLREAHKDLVELEEIADAYDVHYPVGSFAEQQHQLAMNAGYGDSPHPVMLELYEELFDENVESREDRRAKSHGQIL
jgi:3-hydroxyisobutyrate dehydrogenase-like beta-hydroxyacid dehydrogenase